MLKTQPAAQEYANPLKWGWYYVDMGPERSGLMSKRAAKAYRKAKSRETTVHCTIMTHYNAPRIKAFRRMGFPIGNAG